MKLFLWVEEIVHFWGIRSSNHLFLPMLIFLLPGEYYLPFLAKFKIFSFQTQCECLQIDTAWICGSLGSLYAFDEVQSEKIKRNDNLHFYTAHILSVPCRNFSFWVSSFSLLWGATCRLSNLRTFKKFLLLFFSAETRMFYLIIKMNWDTEKNL